MGLWKRLRNKVKAEQDRLNRPVQVTLIMPREDAYNLRYFISKYGEYESWKKGKGFIMWSYFGIYGGGIAMLGFILGVAFTAVILTDNLSGLERTIGTWVVWLILIGWFGFFYYNVIKSSIALNKIDKGIKKE